VLTDSKARIQDELGARVTVVCLPYGYFDSDIKPRSSVNLPALHDEARRVANDSDPHELPRIEMYYFSRRPQI
jgi:hypothetical protein